MGILLLTLGVISIGLMFFLMWKGDTLFLAFMITAFFIAMCPAWLPRNNSPISEYPYQAKVTLAGNEYKSEINFSSFQQVNNEIVIDRYTIVNMHWSDFKLYDVHEVLRITLLDNDNKFIYTDRETGETFNDDLKFATQ